MPTKVKKPYAPDITDVQAALTCRKQTSTRRDRENLARFGINATQAFGVPIVTRALAPSIVLLVAFAAATLPLRRRIIPFVFVGCHTTRCGGLTHLSASFSRNCWDSGSSFWRFRPSWRSCSSFRSMAKPVHLGVRSRVRARGATGRRRGQGDSCPRGAPLTWPWREPAVTTPDHISPQRTLLVEPVLLIQPGKASPIAR